MCSLFRNLEILKVYNSKMYCVVFNGLMFKQVGWFLRKFLQSL